MAGMVTGWSNPLLTMSPSFRVDPLAREKLDQANVLLLAVRWPPALTWMAELAYGPELVKLAPVTFIVPFTVNPKAGLLVWAAATVAPDVMLSVAPVATVYRPVVGLSTYRWPTVVTVPRGARVAVCPAVRVPGWISTSWKRRLLARRVALMAGMVIGWSNPLLKISPLNRMAPLARERPDQAKVLLLAVRWPPAPTWMSELAYEPERVKVAPVTFMVPLTASPNAGVLVAAAAITVPAVTFRVAPARTV